MLKSMLHSRWSAFMRRLLRRPHEKPSYTLEELVARITPENIHPEFDFGPPVGRERFWEDEDDPQQEPPRP
jgi:hypothetical protein